MTGTDDNPVPIFELGESWLDALRLADVGAADDEAFRRVARKVLEDAPRGRPSSTEAPAILVWAIRAADVKLEVA